MIRAPTTYPADYYCSWALTSMTDTADPVLVESSSNMRAIITTTIMLIIWHSSLIDKKKGDEWTRMLCLSVYGVLRITNPSTNTTLSQVNSVTVIVIAHIRMHAYQTRKHQEVSKFGPWATWEFQTSLSRSASTLYQKLMSCISATLNSTDLPLVVGNPGISYLHRNCCAQLDPRRVTNPMWTLSSLVHTVRR